MDIAPPMSDNEALRRIVSEAEKAVELMLEGYDAIEGDADLRPVSSVLPVTRLARPQAVKTVVTSIGPDPVLIREDGKIVHRIPGAGGSWVSALAGAGAIHCSCAEGQSASIALVTYIKGD